MTPCKIIVVTVNGSPVNVIADDVLTLLSLSKSKTRITLLDGSAIDADGTVLGLFTLLVETETKTGK